MTETVTLYGYATSPYVNKVAAFLKFKGLGYDFVPVRPRTNEAIRFTGQTMVPVLTIGEEWRVDSSPLGVWLDERFPDRPILPADPDARARAVSVDDWVSDSLIPGRFREALDWDNALHSVRNAWRLAAIVHDGTPLPLAWRVMWPFAVRKAPFIVRMVNALDRSEPMDAMRARLMDELEAHLQGGPYLGGLASPTIADLSAYITLITPWMTGMRSAFVWRDRPYILAWMTRVQSHLPANPLAIRDRFIRRSAEDAVAGAGASADTVKAAQ